jgi:hypothetical protein
MRKFENPIKTLISILLILGLSAPVLATADTKPVEQFFDQGPEVMSAGTQEFWLKMPVASQVDSLD